MTDLEPDFAERVEHYELGAVQLEELVKKGFYEIVFLDGRPGSAQQVDFTFDWGINPVVTVKLRTVERG